MDVATCLELVLARDSRRICVSGGKKERVWGRRGLDEANGKETERFLDPFSPEHLGKSVVLIE